MAGGDATAVAHAVASLVAGLRARDVKVRIAVSYALSCLGEAAIAALPELLRAAKSDRDFNVRARTLWAFRKMGPRARRDRAFRRNQQRKGTRFRFCRSS